MTIALASLICIFCGALLGMGLRSFLPQHHLSSESKDAVKLATGMIATLTALVLGLLTASAKGTFDTMTNELKQTGAKIMQLDRAMAQYGPETKEAREYLRKTVESSLQRIWPEEKNALVITVFREASGESVDALQRQLRQLSPRNDDQRWLQSRALQLSTDIAEARALLLEQVGQPSLPKPFLVILILWLIIIFASFGLFSLRNATVLIAFFVCALSVAGSLYLILDLDQPYHGLIKISSEPLRVALAHLGQ